MTGVARQRSLVNAPRRAVSIALASAVATVVYRLLAPFAAPPLADLALDRLAASTGAWTARAERIRYEPFALAFDLEGLQISAFNTDVTASARFARVDFSLRSLVSARPVLDRLDIRGGTFDGAPGAASAIWSWSQTVAAEARIAALDAEVAVSLPASSDSQTVSTLKLRGTDLEFGAGRGTLELIASNALGEGSRVDMELKAMPTDAGALLNGSATLSGGHIALGHWRVAARAAAISVEARPSAMPVAASFALVDGVVVASDASVSNAGFELTGGSARWSWQPDMASTEVEASGSLADGGQAALALALTHGGALELNAHLTAVPAPSLAPYAVRALGVEPTSGTIDLELSLGSDPTRAGFARVTAHALRLGSDEPAAATAIALLEEPNGEIAIGIPLASDGHAAEQIVEHVGERVAAVAMAPFMALAELVGRNPAEISTIEFVPGTAEPTPRGQDAIAALAAALGLRKRVGVRLEANEAGELDRAALARAQVALHVLLATAQAEPTRRTPTIDFASQRAQDVLEEFARERLAAGVLEEISASFAFKPDAPTPPTERVEYYRAVFEALVAREPIADTALRRLASFRARAVQRRLSEMGVVDGRVVNDRDSTAFRGDDVLAFLPLALKPAMVPVAQSL